MEFFFGTFDNDKERNLPALKEEQDQIHDAFGGLMDDLQKRGQGSIRREVHFNLGFDGFKEKLIQYSDEMTMFHFSGHHGAGITQLADQVINDKGIARILNGSKRLKIVLLNGCQTASLGELLINVPIVIHTERNIDDYVAKEVGASFYELLCQDITNFSKPEIIKNCFERALGVVEIENVGAVMDRGEKSKTTDQSDKNLGYKYIENSGFSSFEERMNYGLDVNNFDANGAYEKMIEDWFDTQDFSANIHKAKERQLYGKFLYRYFPMPLGTRKK